MSRRCQLGVLRKHTPLNILLISLFMFSSLFAEFDKVATTSAPFLKLGVGARSMAMGGAYVALADDGSALYWNPAGMTRTTDMTAFAGHNDWLLDITHDYVAVTLPTRLGESIGLSISALTMNDQPVRTLDSPDGTGLSYGVMDIAVSAGYARQVTDRLSMGITGKYISLTAYNETAETFALDIGSILKTDFYGLQIGMALSNFGGDLKYEGRDLIVKVDTEPDIDGNYSSSASLGTEPWPLPLMIRIGLAMDLLGPDEAILSNEMSRLTLAVDADHPNDGPEHLNLGLEYAMREMIYLRAGYRVNYDQESWTMGAGVNLKLNGLGQVRLDYAVKPMAVFGNTSILSVQFTK